MINEMRCTCEYFNTQLNSPLLSALDLAIPQAVLSADNSPNAVPNRNPNEVFKDNYILCYVDPSDEGALAVDTSDTEQESILAVEESRPEGMNAGGQRIDKTPRPDPVMTSFAELEGIIFEGDERLDKKSVPPWTVNGLGEDELLDAEELPLDDLDADGPPLSGFLVAAERAPSNTNAQREDVKAKLEQVAKDKEQGLGLLARLHAWFVERKDALVRGVGALVERGCGLVATITDKFRGGSRPFDPWFPGQTQEGVPIIRVPASAGIPPGWYVRTPDIA